MHGELRFVVVFVSGGEDHVGSEIAMGQRNSGVGGHGDGGGDAGHDLEIDAGCDGGLGFLRAASEDDRVAALQAHDVQPLAGTVDDESVDPALFDTAAATVLGDQDSSRRCRRVVKQAGIGEIVVDDDVGVPQAALTLESHEARITGARADEVDLTEHARTR